MWPINLIGLKFGPVPLPVFAVYINEVYILD